MASFTKILDITKSYVPLDPRSFSENYHNTAGEDRPVEPFPVIAYQGINFLPTAYGYKSYFGVNSFLAIEDLPSRAQHVFVVQSTSFTNYLIALCEDGIWRKTGEESGAWEHIVPLTYNPETYKEWTYTTLSNDLYVYRAQDPVYYVLYGREILRPEELRTVWPSPNTGTKVEFLATANPFSGAAEISIAYVDNEGQISLPSAPSSVTFAATKQVNISWTPVVGAALYRIYRRQEGVTYVTESTSPEVIYTSLLLEEEIEEYPEDLNSLLPEFYPLEVEPSFLNMQGQQGIFSAGHRLGFWDSANSIAWSSLDDFSDFTPSIQTLAGSAIFNSVKGRIVNILSHGEGFVIYATKSIIYVRRKIDATFQWEPAVLLTDTGIAFSVEACVAAPDTTHFVYTAVGIYRIEEGRIEVIVPEIYDYLKSMEEPVALKVLQNRFLFLQVLNAEYLVGKVSLTTSIVPATTITFPVSDFDPNLTFDPIELTGQDVCGALQGLGNYHASLGGTPSDLGLGQTLTPIYKAYFSFGNASIDPEFGNDPCTALDAHGVEQNFSPAGDVGKVDNISADYTNKYESQPSWPYRWDTLSFTAAQLAIWRQGDQDRAAFLAAILSKAHSSTLVTPDTGSCTTSLNSQYCELGDYIAEMSDPHWGINSCAFWLTRFVLQKLNIRRRRTVQEICEEARDTLPANTAWYWYGPDAQLLPGITSYAEAFAYVDNEYRNATPPQSLSPSAIYPIDISSLSTFYRHRKNYLSDPGDWSEAGSAGQAWTIEARRSCSSGYTLTDGVCVANSVLYKKTNNVFLRNVGELSEPGIYGVDTAILKLVGWQYRNTEGEEVFLPAPSDVCSIPTPETAPTPSSGNLPISTADGTFCSIPFDPIELPPLEILPVEWPVQQVTIPASTFLMQEGSLGPRYATYIGAFVYDLHLKKWGKFKAPYKVLVEYTPINTITTNTIPYANFGIEGGILSVDGKVGIFDEYPAESSITYGKLGFYRLGYTAIEQIKIHHKQEKSGRIEFFGSLDGKTLDVTLTHSYDFTNQIQWDTGTNMAARWYDIRISGHYDITHIEILGSNFSRR